MSPRQPLPPFTIAIARPAVSSGARPAVWRYVPCFPGQRAHLELHVIVRGASSFEAGDPAAARHVRAGDILLLHGVEEAPSEAMPQGAVTLSAHYADAAADKAFVARHQLGALPRVTHLPAHQRSPTGTVAKLVALLCESSRDTPRLLVQHLFDALLVAVLGASGSALPGRLALSDARIARALLALEGGLHERWTTTRMAKTAGMSRAAFALRFTQTVGAPPLTHLVRLRIARAAALLADTEDTTSEVARVVGYHSVFAFSRAFKRLTGVPPTVYRRRERQCGPIVACAGATRLAA